MHLTTMNRPEFFGFLVLMAVACGPEEPPAEGPSIQVAALANDDCRAPSNEGLPADVQAIDVETSERGARWERVARVTRSLDAASVLVERIPVGEQVEMRFVACVSSAAEYIATVDPLTIREDEKHFLTLHFRRTDALSCTGTAFGPAYNQYAALGRPRAFAAAATLPDGRVLLAGGATVVEGERLRGDAGGAAWDLYAPHETLFLPGVDRAVAYETRPMRVARVGAVALPYAPPGSDETGVLVIGGAPAVEWGSHGLQRGPLMPPGATLSAPAGEYFHPATGGFATVEVSGGELTPRFMPGAAVDDRARVVVAGGLVFSPAGDPTASTLVEVVAAGRLRTAQLPTGLLGPSVTSLGDSKLLVWGADIAGCGARPGWLVNNDPEPTVQQLTIAASPGTPNCQAPPTGCRDWYPTAFHTAARLSDAEGRKRVFVSGGITHDAAGLVHNPDQGAACRPNAFVLSIDVAGLRAEVHPVEVSDDAVKPGKRALHQAARAGPRVLLSGGWANLGTPTALSAADSALFYDDALPVGRLSLAAFTLSEARLGHTTTATRGTVVIAGGLSRDGSGTRIAHTATVYTPPSGAGSCLDIEPAEAVEPEE